jgi:asparagine synthase (glutamine-hydrolysing)
LCGIAGWIDRDANLTRERAQLEVLASALACRGPDAGGYWVVPHAALVHRRLVVIDPEGGRQPMVAAPAGAAAVERVAAGWTEGIGGEPAPDGLPDPRAAVLTYNGELYNTAAVRDELRARGHVFRTRSDTEVVLRAYLEWGEDCPTRLNGIFAFGIWDGRAGRLLLARDRMGVKPLFFARRGTAFLFASELKALLAHRLVAPDVDAEGLAEIFALGPARTPGQGVFRGVEELRPGHVLTLDADGRVRARPYWRLRSEPHADDAATTAATVRELLVDTVVGQLVSDVPIATLLSGGLDSSAVTAIAAARFAAERRGPLRTYSIDFAGLEADFAPTRYYADPDGPWVRRVSEALGTEHRRVVLDTPEQVEALEAAVRARDLPGLADIDSSLYLFCKAIREETTVGLSGEAADEIFGGYPWCHWEEAIASDTFPWARDVEVRGAVLAPDVRAALRPAAYARERYRQAQAEVPRLPGEAPGEARRREILYLNMSRFLPTLLDRKDRMSMAVGLELRVPFCDHRLVEYVWNIPWAMKTAGGVPKAILREAVRGLLPKEVLDRPKVPYPRTFNPAYHAAMRARIRGILEDRSSPLRPLLDVRLLRTLTESESPPAVQWFGQTMSGAQFYAYLWQVDLWLRAYRVRLLV